LKKGIHSSIGLSNDSGFPIDTFGNDKGCTFGNDKESEGMTGMVSSRESGNDKRERT
jgi:hypothetical protein